MIREFVKSDLKNFEPNLYSKYDDYIDIFDNEVYLKYSLIKNNKVEAILCFYNYWEDNWNCFSLMSKDFKFSYAREVKKFMNHCITTLKPKKLETDSVDCEMLNRWHKFIGFDLEGTKRNHIYGQNINMWGIVWE